MRRVRRPPGELVRQAMSEHHRRAGFDLLLGTRFGPVRDRDAPGRALTHRAGDIVHLPASPRGVPGDRAATLKNASRYRGGVGGAIENIAGRGQIGAGERQEMKA